MRIPLRYVLIGLVALVAFGGLITSGAISTVSQSQKSSDQSTSIACDSSGVTLVIEYGASKGTQSYCVENFSGTGWDLFAAAGQKVEGTSEYPVGFVCRINDFPTQQEQPCTTTPSSADGTWAYYFASARTGDHWMFSGVGASMRKPLCGDFDAWVFLAVGEKSHEPLTTPHPVQCKN